MNGRSAPSRPFGAAARDTRSGFGPLWLTDWLTALPGNRYSRRVAVLKRALPVIGVSLLLLVTVWPRIAPLLDRLRFTAIDLREARELRMMSPRYAGTDREGRPFVVTASVGRQVPGRDDVMSLEAPKADMKAHSGAAIVVTADSGVYQSPTQLLDLFGNVTLVHENGTRLVTSSARLDAANNAAEGHEPIEGHGPSGDIKAQGFQVIDKGDIVIFTGHSDLLLKGAKAGEPKAEPVGLPAPIAEASAQIAAKAAPPQPAPAVRPHPVPAAHAPTSHAAHTPPAHKPAPKKSGSG